MWHTSTHHRVLLPTPIHRITPCPREILLPGHPPESYYYVYFFTDTVNTLKISRAVDESFWQKFLHAPSQHLLCFRQAVIALGATHWLFQTHTCQDSALSQFALRQYQEAIFALKQSTIATKDWVVDMSTIIICCVLFVCLESLLGNFSEAIRHLRAGSRLIASHISSTGPSISSLQELAALVHAMSSEINFFTRDRLFSDLGHLTVRKRDLEDAKESLYSLDEAEDVLNSFVDVVNRISWDLNQNWEDPESECNRQWTLLRNRVRVWHTGFRDLASGLAHGGQDASTSTPQIAKLRIQHKLWELLLDGTYPTDENMNECEPGLGAAECNLLLVDIESAWRGSSSSGPLFTLKTELNGVLFQLYAHCTDESVRRRIISMLRSQQRRELVWDSFKLASFLETDMHRRSQGIQTERWPTLGPSSDEGALLTF